MKSNGLEFLPFTVKESEAPDLSMSNVVLRRIELARWHEQLTSIKFIPSHGFIDFMKEQTLTSL